MKKQLKLRIAKFNRMLVVEQLELEGKWKETNHVRVFGSLLMKKAGIDLKEDGCEGSFNFAYFEKNEKRDEYAQKLINWITEEQFGGVGKLEVGKECLVFHDGKEWSKKHLLAILPKNKKYRYIVCSNLENEKWTSCEYAKPIDDCLKIDGEIYTWETEDK